MKSSHPGTYRSLLSLNAAVTFLDASMPLALPWLAFDIGHSLTLMALLYMVEALVPLAAGIWLTPWITRVGPMRTLRAGQWSRAAMLFGALVLYAIDWRTGLLVWLFATAGVVGTGTVITESALRAAIPASGIGSTSQAGGLERIASIVRLTALPTMGVALGIVGGRGVLLLLCVLSAAAGALVPLVPQANPAQIGARGAVRATEGMRRMWQNGAIRSLALQAMVGNFGNTLVMSSLLFYLRASLHLRGTGVALTYGAMALGSFLGTLLVVPLLHRLRRGTLYPLFLTGGLLGLLVLQVRLPWAPGLGEGLVAMCDTAWVVMSTGLRLERIAVHERAQVLTASRVLSNSVVPLAGIASATVGPALGIPLLFLFAAFFKAAEIVVASSTEIRLIDSGRCCAAGSA